MPNSSTSEETPSYNAPHSNKCMPELRKVGNYAFKAAPTCTPYARPTSHTSTKKRSAAARRLDVHMPNVEHLGNLACSAPTTLLQHAQTQVPKRKNMPLLHATRKRTS